MERWNPIGWTLLAGGFLFSAAVAGFGLVGSNWGGSIWLIGYLAMLVGLAILITNMLRALWRFGRRQVAVLTRNSS